MKKTESRQTTAELTFYVRRGVGGFSHVLRVVRRVYVQRTGKETVFLSQSLLDVLVTGTSLLFSPWY